MSITLLYGCCQIETSVRDLHATRAFMQTVLGAGQIEQQLAKQICELFPDGGYQVDHLDCGEAMFQVNEPSPSILYRGQKSIHQAYLDRIGNCVTNLNFFVDDAAHAQELLTGLGAPIHLQGPSSAASCLTDYGPRNTRPDAALRQFYFMGSRELIGFDLELMEPNFLHFTQQTVQYPCFVRPRPATGDGNLELQRLRVVVPDLRHTYSKLSTIFAPASRSKPYGFQRGSQGTAFRIGLGGIEIEYCQPLFRDHGYLANELARFGPGVVAIEFAARDLDRILRQLRERDAPATQQEVDFLGPENSAAFTGVRYRVACRALTGFDVVLEQRKEALIG